MSNATPASIGRVNASGSEDALFLKVFSSEVLASFERTTATDGAELVRSISSGKSSTFPVMGRISAEYHTPGAEILGSDVNHNEKVITINDLLIAHTFVADIEDAKLHYDIRSIYSTEIGRALAYQKDLHTLQTMVQAAKTTTANVGDSGYGTGTELVDSDGATSATSLTQSIFDAAAALDDNYVPAEDRFVFLKPTQYYLLANGTNAVNVDFSGQGSIADGKVVKLAGMTLVKVPHLPSSNVTSGVSAGSATQGGSTPQAVDASDVTAIVAHKSAVGTVKLMDVAVEVERDIRRQGTLMVGKYSCGHGVLRPEASAIITSA